MHSIVESLVALTAQRDIAALEASFVASLNTLLDAECAIFPVSDDFKLSPDHHREHDALLGLAVLKALPQVLERDLPHSIETPGRHSILMRIHKPVRSDSRILLARMRQPQPDAERLIGGLSMVYRNLVTLLADNEHDTLTGLFNRRKLEHSLSSLCRQSPEDAGAERQNYLGILDIDKFKRINDTYGHLIGDEVLLLFAEILRKSLRVEDMAFRFGGEEFMVLIHEVTPETAHAIFERIRCRVEAFCFPQVGQVTISIGYSRTSRTLLPPQVIESADRALYYAKEHGRNQVQNFQALANWGLCEPIRESGPIVLF